MRLMATMAIAALLSGAAAAKDDETFTVKVYASGMSWAGSWGSKVQKALERLDGVSKVVMTYEEGLFEVTAKESSKIKFADLKGAVGSYTLEKIEVALAGEVSKDDKGLWLAARGSGTKYLLANRPKKDDADKPEDVVAKVEGLLKEGKKLVKVGGGLVEKEEKVTIHLGSAEAIEKK